MSDKTHQAIEFLERNNWLREGDPDPNRKPPEGDWDAYPMDWSAITEIQSEAMTDGWRLFDDREAPTVLTGEMPRLQGGLRADEWAWYQPIHYHADRWGIMIREEAIAGLARFLDLRLPERIRMKFSPADLHYRLGRAAFFVYFLHEQFHHKIESLAFRLQVVMDRAVYHPYLTKVYDEAVGTDDLLEEALAHADIYLRIGTSPYSKILGPDLVDFVRQILEEIYPYEPEGYQRAVEFLDRRDFEAGENLLQCQVKEASLTPKQSPQDWNVAPRMTQSMFQIRQQIFLVVPKGATPRISGRILRAHSCSSREMIRLLKRWGFEMIPGGKGSHLKMRGPNGKQATVPGAKSRLSPNVAKQLLSLLGPFSLSDLPALLSGAIRGPNGSPA